MTQCVTFKNREGDKDLGQRDILCSPSLSPVVSLSVVLVQPSKNATQEAGAQESRTEERRCQGSRQASPRSCQAGPRTGAGGPKGSGVQPS